MMKKTTIKRVALVGLLLVLLVAISGCLTRPDTVDTLPAVTDEALLPFQTVTPSPSPSPTPDPAATVDQVVLQGQQGGDGTTVEQGQGQTQGQGQSQGDWQQWQPGGDGTTGEGTGSGTGGTQPPITVINTATPTAPPQWTYSPPAATATATSDGSLRYGSKGSEVTKLQQRLKDLGYYTGSVDGAFGPGTETALKEFQKANGLTADGIAGSRTLSTINSSSAKSKPKATATAKATKNAAYATSRPTPVSYTPSTPSTYRYLQLGSSGSDVTRLQNRLKELNYFKGTVNGKFGDETEAAVYAFQERNGLWVDGVAGEDTQRMLFSSGALPAAAGSSNNAVPFTGYRSLAVGDSGEDVSALQERLAELGYYAQKSDAAYGQSTAEAVQAFQTRNSLTPDGVAGVNTQIRLYSTLAVYAPVNEITAQTAIATETLEKGSMGEEVYRLQERLYDLGYYTGRIDGIYSDAVFEAVRAFQRLSSLTADGKAGKTTLTRLYADKATPAKDGGDDTYATLRQGDEDERVRALQSLLASYGYFGGDINGRYGEDTTSAVTALQRQHGLTPDGVAGPATQQLLYDGSPQSASLPTDEAALADAAQGVTFEALRQGMGGPDVTMLQQFLEELGYFSSDEAGVFGPSTLLAVQDFQQQNGMEPDGVAGQETLALLYSGLGLPAEIYYTVAVETPERDAVREGDEGQDVFTMQERLVQLGFLPQEPDGKYGAATTSAVKLFQSANGLTADGVAGAQTLRALYATNVKAAVAVQSLLVDLSPVDNRERELYEQETSGAIQASLGGGGVAASYNSNVYYVGKGGALYRATSGGGARVYDGKASYIHASDKGLTFISGNKILRTSTSGANVRTLATSGGLRKLSVLGDTLVYQDGATLVRDDGKTGAQTLFSGINDFAVDTYDYIAYTAGDDGLYSVGLNGNAPELLVSDRAMQVQVAGGTVFYRAAAGVYRLVHGVSVLVVPGDIDWMGVYRDKLYYTSGTALYRCNTDGSGSELFFSGPAAQVSFVAGNVYITGRAGGEVTDILPAEG